MQQKGNPTSRASGSLLPAIVPVNEGALRLVET